MPELTLHWLAVEGHQPSIPENPSIMAEEEEKPLLLQRELQQFYMRVTGVLLAADKGDRTLRAVLSSLSEDGGLQELVPYFSRFVYQQVRANRTSLPLLKTMISVVQALISNPNLRMEFHLQQLLPAIFTCIVASKLSNSPQEDHWSLRVQAAAVIARICQKYSALFPDLQARVCKTYIDALSKEKSLSTVYGGMLGLSTLGQGIVRSLLLPQVVAIGERLDKMKFQGTSSSSSSNSGSSSSSSAKGSARVGNKLDVGVQMCLAALVHTLGIYIVHSLRFASVVDVDIDDPFRASSSSKGTFLSLSTTTAASEEEATTPSSKKRKLTNKKAVAVSTTVTSSSSSSAPSLPTDAATSPSIMGLEEALIPYYASVAPDAAHCRLFI